MFGVYAPDADAVRGLIPNVDQLLDLPYCAYLFVLAREVDHEAVTFLERYWNAVHQETGEAVAVIVLYDDIRVVGTLEHAPYDVEEPGHILSVVNSQRIAYGSYTIRKGQISNSPMVRRAIYAASPRWSLKFADEIGLSRAFLPCIVAMDRPEGANDGGFVVLDLSDAELAWTALRDAVTSFMEQQDSYDFVLAIERLRKLRTLARDVERKVRDTEPPQQLPLFWPTYSVPDTPAHLVTVLAQRSPANAQLTSMVASWPSFAEERHRDAAALLAAVAEDLPSLRAVVGYRTCADRLSTHWVGAQILPGFAPARVAKRLSDALRIVGREPRRSAIDQLLTMEAPERIQFVAAVLEQGAARLEAINYALAAMRESRPPTPPPAPDKEHRETLADLTRIRDEIAAEIAALKPPAFLPHLELAIDNLPPATTPAKKARHWRSSSAKIAGAAGFGAAIVQILQGIGVVR